MTIRILVTGGTFDKEYDELSGKLFFKDTHVDEMLSRGRCRLDMISETVMMIDSLEMTDADRAIIVQSCVQTPGDRIVITHGTDTMTDTAAAIAKQAPAKTIVLTGAMVPYAFGSSDGLFNLGSALSFVQVLPPGVYIAMNGKCFPWNRVRKNRERGELRSSRRRADVGSRCRGGAAPREQEAAALNKEPPLPKRGPRLTTTQPHLVEALAVGCTAIATDCPSGPREILGDDEYGLVTVVGGVDELAKAIERLLTDARLVERLRRTGRKRAEDFDLNSTLPQLIDLLGQATGGIRS